MTQQDALKIRFTRLVERQKEGLEAVCRQFFPWDDYHQRELMQHILLRLWHYLQEHSDEDEEQWERWCPHVARQVACNYLKTHEYNQGLRMVTLDEGMKESLPALDDETKEELERTQRVLQQLNAEDYRLVELYTSDISNAEIARMLGISLRKLQYRIRDVKKKIQYLNGKING